MSAKKQIAKNMAMAEKSGYRLQRGRATPALATCRRQDLVILGGLGGFGCGIMGFSLSAHGRVSRRVPDFKTPAAANRYVIKEYGMGAINL